MATQVPQSIVDQFTSLTDRIKNEGITDNSGKVLLAPSQSPVLPKADPYNPNIAGVASANDANKVMVDFYSQQAKDYKTALDKATSEGVNAPKSFDDFLSTTGKQSPNAYMSSKFSEIGVDPSSFFAELKADTAAVDALNKDLNNTIAARDKQIADVMGRPGASLDFQSNQIAQINRNANVVIGQKTANLNAKMALVEMKKGNFNDAQNFVKDAVTAYTNVLEQDLNLFREFRQQNRDLINNLDKKYQDAIANEFKVKEAFLIEEKSGKEKVGNLMLQFPDAGITMSDTLDQALAKATRVAGRKTDIIGSSDTGYSLVTYDNSGKVISKTPIMGGTVLGGGSVGTTGFKNSKVEADLRADAVALLDQVEAGATTLDKAYSRLRTLYSPNEVGDDAIKKILGITTSASPTSTAAATAGAVTGKGPLANVSIDTRIKELQDFNTKYGLPKNTGVRDTLLQNGYPAHEVKKRTGDVFDKIEGFMGGVYNSLFGK